MSAKKQAVKTYCMNCDRMVNTYLRNGVRRFVVHYVTPYSGPGHACSGSMKIVKPEPPQ